MEKQNKKRILTKENARKAIIAVEAAFCVGAIAGITYCCGYKRGFLLGGCVGFEETVKWLEETFPEKGVEAAVKAFKEANPDKWVTIK